MELDIQGHKVLVSEEDYELVKRFNWRIDAQGYAVANISMHRLISDPDRPLVVDHINRNRLDNRRENLRNVTQAENCLNVERDPKYYHYLKDRDRWRVKIAGKQWYFKTEKEAIAKVLEIKKEAQA